MYTTSPAIRFPSTNDKFDELTIDEIHQRFHRTYLFGTEEQKKLAQEQLRGHSKFDPNYDEGLFFVVAAENGDEEFLKWLFKKADEKEAQIDPDTIFNALLVAARDGHKGCVELLIDKGADPESLLDYTAYDNHIAIKTLLDEKIAAKKNSVMQAGTGTLAKLAYLSISPVSEKATSSIESPSSQAEISSIASLSSSQKIEEISQANALSSIEKKIQDYALACASPLLYTPFTTIETLVKKGEVTLIRQAVRDNTSLTDQYIKKQGITKEDLLTISAALEKTAQYEEGTDIKRTVGTTYLNYPEKEDDGIQLLKDAAAQGDIEAQVTLGDFFLHAEKNDFVTAYNYLKYPAIQHNNRSAQELLGEMYYHGNGVEQNYKTARGLFERAEKQGGINAAIYLGLIYYQGQEVKKNIPKVLRYLDKPDQENNIDAQAFLGFIHYFEDSYRDYSKASEYIIKVANSHTELAPFFQAMLGIIYYLGQGVTADEEKAFAYFKTAADQGHVDAQHITATLYAKRENKTTEDCHRMLHYYLCAANQSYYPSIFALTIYYIEAGQFENATLWLEYLARDINSKLAKKMLDINPSALDNQTIESLYNKIHEVTDIQNTLGAIKRKVEILYRTVTPSHSAAKKPIHLTRVKESLLASPSTSAKGTTSPTTTIRREQLTNFSNSLKKQKARQSQPPKHSKITRENIDIANRIFANDPTLTLHDFLLLFRDPVLCDQLIICPQQAGFSIREKKLMTSLIEVDLSREKSISKATLEVIGKLLTQYNITPTPDYLLKKKMTDSSAVRLDKHSASKMNEFHALPTL